MGNINLGFTEGQGKNCVYKDENVIDESCKGKVAIYDENVMLRSVTPTVDDHPSCVATNEQLHRIQQVYSIYDLSKNGCTLPEDKFPTDLDKAEELHDGLQTTVATFNTISITFTITGDTEINEGYGLSLEDNEDGTYSVRSYARLLPKYYPLDASIVTPLCFPVYAITGDIGSGLAFEATKYFGMLRYNGIITIEGIPDDFSKLVGLSGKHASILWCNFRFFYNSNITNI